MTAASPTANAEPTNDLPSGRWLALTLGLIALLMLVSAAIALQMDLFGIFRDPHGRQLITSTHERKAKYLLNQAYVPANFDALIIGASASVNWHPEDISGYRVYNESLEGGNASEERKLVEQALPKGHFKLAIIALYPRITSLHVLQDGFDKVDRTEALGSISAYGIEYDALRDRLSHRTPEFFANGSHVLPIHEPPTPAGAPFGGLDLPQDDIAANDYLAVVKELQARGTRIVYIACPLFQRFLVENQTVITDYLAWVKATMPPATIIDFNAPQYIEFRSTPSNYIDEIHLSDAGADLLSRMIAEQLKQLPASE